ncbi:uncharacterized protein A1O9_05290 [Exophiala aquamarina CBS 119918]|uniref:t-SNARE coiled-coil homology domain-containing protein n=1 Tax=Exophiala aquamarina CBS 119918 TaxID=1182545 RepID=A0A072PDL1_9EURO|nr:uncharacterized protein A1O9_05290 [Exophiala aquamarina CBS 119918]KEF57373.1 hypothetical protein A1O9_05290 [Exophiala aquamarina CBS 119918]
MSLASTLSPIGISFRREHTPTQNGPKSVSFQHETNYLNLHRTLLRLQHLILLTPAPILTSKQDAGTLRERAQLTPLQSQIQAELWSPLPYSREKWLQDVEGARTLLLQLERQAQSIRVQRAKYEAIKDLAEKRAIVKRLRNRIEEIGREVELMGSDDYKPPYRDDNAETLFDALREHSQATGNEDKDHGISKDGVLFEGKLLKVLEEDDGAPDVRTGQREELFSSSEVRRRGGNQDKSSNSSDARTTGFSNLQSTERSLLDSSRVHEDITASLVSMAAQLKQQSRAMHFSLEQDKGLVGKALEGLDISLTGMESASKNMAFLKRMSEEEGWLGRMKLYAMIFAMWIAAFLLVFVCPKLRF